MYRFYVVSGLNVVLISLPAKRVIRQNYLQLCFWWIVLHFCHKMC